MPFVYSPYILPLIAAALVATLTAGYAWSRRTVSGALALFIMSVAIVIWTVGYSLEIAGIDLSTKYAAGVIQYFGIAFAPYIWLVFSLTYSNQAHGLTRRAALGLAVVPALTVLLALTTQWHGLIWREFHIIQQGNFSALGVSYGWWFWVHFAYSYLCLLIGTILLGRVLWRRQGLYRGQVIALIIAALTPWISNALYLTGNSPIPYLDPTPFAFTVTVAALAWAIFGFHLVDITPIARDLVVESMRDGMIVLDRRGYLVDINTTAARMIGVPASQALGTLAAEILKPWPHLIEQLTEAVETNTEITVGRGNAQRHYEVRLSLLIDQQNQLVGRVIMMRALNEALVPEPRFAVREAVARPDTPAQQQPTAQTESKSRVIGLGWLIDFIATPIKTDLEIPPDVSPNWYQARERSFTIILRVAALLGTFAYVFTLPLLRTTSLTGVNIIYGGMIGLLWFLGLARQINFRYRAVLFLGLLFTISFIETISFGYSVESFVFFATLIITSVLLTGRKGGVVSAGISVITLGIFGWLIGQAGFVPFSLTSSTLAPRSLELGITSLLVFLACVTALAVSITILTESLNHAWQQEAQALNLLQQERDLLEKHVTERTSDLARARDAAVETVAEQKLLQVQLQKQNDYLATLHATTIDLLNRKDVTSLLTAIASQAATLVEAPHGYIFLAEGQDLVLQAATSSFAANIGNREAQPGTGVLGSVWQSLQPIVIENYAQWEGRDPDYARWKLRALAGIPIIARGEPLGVLEVARLEGDARTFTPQEVEALIRFAALVSLVLDNAQLYASAQNEITERKRAEILLQESEARFRQIVENASDIIYRADANGHFTYVNPVSLRLIGFESEDQVVGKHYLELAKPDWRHRLKRFYEHQLLSKENSTYFEFPALTTSGEEVWLGQSVQLIKEGEVIIGVQAVARDITKLRQIGEALALSRDQALEASRLKSQILSRVSHELRTPLGSILGYAELLEYNAFGDLSQQQHEAVVNIIESTNYLTTVVNDLLDESQIESKSLKLNSEYFVPTELLEKVKASLAVIADKKGLVFQTHIASDLPGKLFGDLQRLQQIIINLAGNAIKFTKAGEVRINLKRTQPTEWSIEVSDTGVGIPRTEHATIYEPFRQINNAITRENPGSGLGLTITKQLVELMNGQIFLQSELGQGSTFTILLPVVTAPK